MPTRQCTKCGETKPLEMFRKQKRSPDGRESRCKDCRNAYAKLYREQNKQKIKLLRKRYIGDYLKPYRERYREQNRKRKRRYRQERPETWKAQNAIYTEVRAGRLPKVSSLFCNFCGAQAAHYHHHLGYTPEHWLDVIPLCCSCHQQAHSN